MEAITTKPTGQPAFTPEQPVTGAGGIDSTATPQAPAKGAPTGSEAAKAAIAAKAAAGKVTTPVVAPAASAPAVAAPAAAGELTDEAMAAAGDKAKLLAETRAAVVDPPDDFAAKAAKAAEAVKAGDHLKALEILGIPLDGAVRQATGAPATTTEEEALKAENTRLRAEAAETKRKGDEATAAATAQAAYHATVAAVVSDKAFPNITTPEHVNAALADAKAAHRVLVADLGRPLNEAEKDRLVKLHLKRYNDKATGEQAPSAAPSVTPSVAAGAVQPARPAKRSVAQVKADILAGKGKRTN